MNWKLFSCAKSALLATLAVGLLTSLAPSSAMAKGYPVPSVFEIPTNWYLTVKHGIPKRIVVDVPGDPAPTAYWYITYTITNNTSKEQDYYPHVEMVTNDGKIHLSDRNIPLAVFEKIRRTEGNDLLMSATKMAGTIHQGEDQAKDGVAIWAEPMARMGEFSIYITGLNNEAAPATDDNGQPIKDDQGEPIKLWKTLQLNYVIYGDEVKPGADDVHVKPEKWVMR